MRFVASFLVLLGSQCLVTSAQAKALYLDLTVAGEHQRSRMDAGVEAIDSSVEHSSVRIQVDENKVSKRGQFSISAFNASSTPSNFGTENITISFGDGPPVAVISYDRLLKEEKNRQMWAAIAAGLSAAGNSMSAAQAGYSWLRPSMWCNFGGGLGSSSGGFGGDV